MKSMIYGVHIYYLEILKLNCLLVLTQTNISGKLPIWLLIYS